MFSRVVKITLFLICGDDSLLVNLVRQKIMNVRLACRVEGGAPTSMWGNVFWPGGGWLTRCGVRMINFTVYLIEAAV